MKFVRDDSVETCLYMKVRLQLKRLIDNLAQLSFLSNVWLLEQKLVLYAMKYWN